MHICITHLHAHARTHTHARTHASTHTHTLSLSLTHTLARARAHTHTSGDSFNAQLVYSLASGLTTHAAVEAAVTLATTLVRNGRGALGAFDGTIHTASCMCAVCVRLHVVYQHPFLC